MSLIIRQVLLDDTVCDIAIKDNLIADIAPSIAGEFDQEIDGRNQLAIPPFYNLHCHGAMSLLRGFADDLHLFDWLQNHIWPAEAKLTAEDIYWGSRLACLEMIRTGTVFFNDMYFHPLETVQAVEDAGIRAAIGMINMDISPEATRRFQQANEELFERRSSFSDRITLTCSPHAIYTVSDETLRNVGTFAAENNLMIHIHLSETAQEVDQCIAEHGCTPVEYIRRLGLLDNPLIAAHGVHLTDPDVEILARHNATVVYMPCSNHKLVSGRCRFRSLLDGNCRVAMGTDGCASNNNLSMFDEMKLGALAAKLEAGDATKCQCQEIFHAAVRSGAEAFGINGGQIRIGALADILLLDLESPLMVPGGNMISNIVYSADSSCVKTLICDGRILMLNQVIPDSAEILAHAREISARLRA